MPRRMKLSWRVGEFFVDGIMATGESGAMRSKRSFLSPKSKALRGHTGLSLGTAQNKEIEAPNSKKDVFSGSSDNFSIPFATHHSSSGRCVHGSSKRINGMRHINRRKSESARDKRQGGSQKGQASQAQGKDIQAQRRIPEVRQLRHRIQSLVGI